MRREFKLILFFLVLLLPVSCQKERALPVVTTIAVTATGSDNATVKGSVTSDGGDPVTARGLCWGLTPAPGISPNSVLSGKGKGEFSATIASLAPGTQYYVRAYATNGVGTAYGADIQFSTSAIKASLTTTQPSAITPYSATSGGNVTNDGGGSVSARGVCWGTSTNPTLNDHKSTDGTGTGEYTSSITDLVPGTRYYIRAYAVNIAGTVYGNELYFDTPPVLPQLSTAEVSNISASSAMCGGEVSYNGGAEIISRGVCWGLTSSPTINDSKTSDTQVSLLNFNPFSSGVATGSFISTLSPLQPGTEYYVRAYAVNSAGVAYGGEKVFRTLAKLAAVTTNAATSVASTSALISGVITDDGGGAVTDRGIYWSAEPSPGPSGTKVSAGSGNGNFSVTLSGLTPGKSYFVRSYAVNSAGTIYGNEITFTTLASLPVITTSAVNNLTSGSAKSGGVISYDGGGAVTSRGVCWSTEPDPAVTGSKTEDGSGSGSFISVIGGLQPSTTYYIRAYAVNSAGVAYGNSVICTTLSQEAALLTSDVSSVTHKYALCGGNIFYDGGLTITSRGVCWSTNGSPTVESSKTVNGGGSGIFESSMNDLTPSTTYFVRAYAVSSAGVFYGDIKTFTTLSDPAIPNIETTIVRSIGTTSAIAGGVIVPGSLAVTSFGICWSSSPSPTTDNNKIVNSGQYGVFESTITNLTPNRVYYVRAYAEYGGVVKYGAQVSFSTLPEDLSVTTSESVSATAYTMRLSGSVASAGEVVYTEKGFCYSKVSAPTISENRVVSNTDGNTIEAYLDALDPSSVYYVRAYAINASGVFYGNQVVVNTAPSSEYYSNGEYVGYFGNTRGGYPCEVLILGDGYRSEDFKKGGKFDQETEEGAEALFSVEPFKSYRSYFSVYKMATYSQDEGVTQNDLSIVKNSALSTAFNGGTSVSVSTDDVFRYVNQMSGMTAERLRNMLIIVIINQNRYAGTCFMWTDGRAIALCPVSRSTDNYNDFGSILIHEAGGHGWSGLADEYIAYPGATISSASVSTYNAWSTQGFFSNIDVTGDLSQVKWKQFLGLTGYDRVGAFEGAYYYDFGVWRPEESSCMMNNIHYFNAPSREAAVKKIKRVAGETYSLNDFISNDSEKTPVLSATLKTFNTTRSKFVPLSPPILLK